MKKILLILGAILGEALIVLILLEFYEIQGQRIFIQNLFFLTLAYTVILAPLMFPWVSLKDKEQKWVGSLGIQLSSMAFYVIATLLAVICCNASYPPVEPKYQLLIHMFLLLIFVVSLSLGSWASEKVGQVYRKEAKMEEGIKQIKSQMDMLMLNANMNADVPQEIKDRYTAIINTVRYISPAGTDEAIKLEQDILKVLYEMDYMTSNYATNKAELERSLLFVENLIGLRKKCLV